MKGRTTFIVAQRLSTIQRADPIFVLQDGTIAEQGDHRELMERDGFFNRLFRLQLGADEAAAGSRHAARSPVLSAQGKESAI